MYNPVLKWKKPLVAGDVASYHVTWTYNGVAGGSGNVAQNGASDMAGYAVSFSTHNPATVLKDGDVVGASVTATDTSGLSSPPVTPAVVTIPSEPPDVPTLVTLTLV